MNTPPIPIDETFVPSLDLHPEPASRALPAAPPRPDLRQADAAAEQSREAAFDAEFQWNGAPLQPFSIDRYCAFLSHRAAMGAPSIGEAIGRDGLGFYPDALRILWLCSVKPASITSLRGSPERMEQSIHEWAATAAPPALRAEAITAALQIWNAANENQPEARQHASSAAGRGTDMGN